MSSILIVDDDRETCQFIAELLAAPGREIAWEFDPREALKHAESAPVDLVISDINLNAKESGLDILRAAKKTNPHVQVVLISGFGTLETAIEAVRAGAFDYISKPFDIGQVKSVVERALVQAAAPDAADVHLPRETLPGLIGRTSGDAGGVQADRSRRRLEGAGADHRGERHGQGTGGESHPHARPARSTRPFVAVNCGAIAETLLESELFGHTRGSFTGAVSDAKGLLRAGARRHGVPRRDRRDLSVAPGQAAAGARGG